MGSGFPDTGGPEDHKEGDVMDKRIFAAVAVLAMGLVCLAPVIADDVSAEQRTDRISDVYVVKAEFVIDTIPSSKEYHRLYMVDGSDNHKAIEAYLKDPQNVSYDLKDDFNELRNHMYEKLWVYEYREDRVWDISYGSQHAYTTVVLEPYNLEKKIVGDPKDVIKLKVLSFTGNDGTDFGDFYFFKNEDRSWHYTKSTFSFEVEAGSEYRILTRNGSALYYTIEYDLNVEKPNGSPNAFAAICIAISALTIALLVASALKPKWSK